MRSGTLFRGSAVCTALAAFAAAGCEVLPTAAESEEGALGALDACPPGTPGSFDTTFGGGTGIARVSFGADDRGRFFDLEVQGSSIIAAGTGFGGLGGSGFVVTRLLENGDADPSFNGGERIKTLFVARTSSYAYAHALGLSADGSPVLVGWHELGFEPGDLALARYTPTGEQDPDFGGGEEVLIDLGGAEQIHDGALLGDDRDRSVLVGERDGAILVARTTAQGALDTTFAAPAGYLSVPLAGGPASATGVAIDSEGRLVIAGHVGDEGARDLVVLRLLPGGAPDPEFGNDGRVTLTLPGSDERAAALELGPGGEVVIAADSNAGDARDFLVARLLPGGALDSDYGDGGLARAATTDGADSAVDLVVLADGGVIVGGNASGGSSPGPVIARYTPSGQLAPGFGDSGVLPLFLGEYASIETLALYPDNRLLIGGGDEGMTPGPGTYGIVARLWL